MDKDWAALAAAISARMAELGMSQQELARASDVSPAKVRELQRNYEPHRAAPRTLAALSEALRWPSSYLKAVLDGNAPVTDDSPGLAQLRHEVADLRERVTSLEEARES